MNNDLPKHAVGKVDRALKDVYQIADSTGEMLRIALMSAGTCIGQAGGFLAAMMKEQGVEISDRQAKEEILKLVRSVLIDGAEAAWAALEASESPKGPA